MARTLGVVIGGPIAVWLVTTAASKVGGVVADAWSGKETVAAHTADIGTLRAERRALADSLRNQRALDSSFMQRILDATCADRPNVRACRP